MNLGIWGYCCWWWCWWGRIWSRCLNGYGLIRELLVWMVWILIRCCVIWWWCGLWFVNSCWRGCIGLVWYGGWWFWNWMEVSVSLVFWWWWIGWFSRCCCRCCNWFWILVLVSIVMVFGLDGVCMMWCLLCSCMCSWVGELWWMLIWRSFLIGLIMIFWLIDCRNVLGMLVWFGWFGCIWIVVLWMVVWFSSVNRVCYRVGCYCCCWLMCCLMRWIRNWSGEVIVLCVMLMMWMFMFVVVVLVSGWWCCCVVCMGNCGWRLMRLKV